MALKIALSALEKLQFEEAKFIQRPFGEFGRNSGGRDGHGQRQRIPRERAWP